MSAQANDPRLPSAAKPFVAKAVDPQDLPVDYSRFIVIVFDIAGVMFRYKLSSWLAIILYAQSLTNNNNLENDLKDIFMAMMQKMFGIGDKLHGSRSTGKSKLTFYM